MNKDQVNGKWLQFRGKLKETWGKLTDDELDRYNGKKDQFIGRLTELYGITTEEAEERLGKMEKECDYSCSCSSSRDVA